jgi:hypothetical protein
MPKFPGANVPARTPGEAHRKHLAFQRWAEEEESRIIQQRRFLGFKMLPPIARNLLIKAMMDRAWELLDMGEVEAADAILEFVPEVQAGEVLDAFFNPDEI